MFPVDNHHLYLVGRHISFSFLNKIGVPPLMGYPSVFSFFFLLGSWSYFFYIFPPAGATFWKAFGWIFFILSARPLFFLEALCAPLRCFFEDRQTSPPVPRSPKVFSAVCY